MCLYTALGRLHPTHRIPTDARSYIDSLSLYTYIEPFEEMRWFRFLFLFRRPIDLSGTTEQRNVHDSLLSIVAFFFDYSFLPSVLIYWRCCRLPPLSIETHTLFVGCSGNRPSRSNKHLRVGLASCRKSRALNLSLWGSARWTRQ